MTYTLKEFNEFRDRTGFTMEDICEHTGYSRPGFNKFLYSPRLFNKRIVRALESMEKIKELEDKIDAMELIISMLKKQIEMMERRDKIDIEENKGEGS